MVLTYDVFFKVRVDDFSIYADILTSIWDPIQSHVTINYWYFNSVLALCITAGFFVFNEYNGKLKCENVKTSCNLHLYVLDYDRRGCSDFEVIC